MKKLFLIPICLLFLFSCKKEAVYLTEDSTESAYKEKFSKILKTTPISKEELKKRNDAGIAHFEFDTYEEAYKYFSFLEKKITDSIKTEVQLKATPERALQSAGMDYQTYGTWVNSSSSITHTFGTGTVNCMYNVEASFGFMWTQSNSSAPKFYNQFAFLGISSSPGTLYYGGIGTTSTSEVHITTSAPNNGYISGIMQGSATIGGTSASFIISVTGGFNANPPQNYSSGPPSAIMITHWLNASSS